MNRYTSIQLVINSVLIVLLMSTVSSSSQPPVVGAATISGMSAPGDLDTSFGIDGKVMTNFARVGSSDYANALAIQPDGKLVVAGYTYSGANNTTALARYNANGTLDASFSTGGQVITPIGTASVANALAIQGDGKLIVAGTSDSKFALARYNSDGTLDTTFDTDGKVITPIGGTAYALAIQGDDKLVVAGSSGGDFALARYNPNGSLDTSFGLTGTVVTDMGWTDVPYALAIQSDGKLVVAGYQWVRYYNGLFWTYEYDWALARYNSIGTLDTSFSTDGKVTTSIGFGDNDEYAHALGIQTDGKLVVAGQSGGNFALARYNSNGTLDTTFDTDGKVTTDLGGLDEARGLVIQADGKLLVAGYSGTDIALARYNSDGSTDTSFGVGGKVTTDFGGKDEAQALIIQPNGKSVAAGSTDDPFNRDIVLARYNSDGALDTGFDTDGKVVTGFGSASFGGLSEQVYALAIQSDGKLVAAGYALNGEVYTGNYDIVLARYNSDGTLDASFGIDGRLTTDLGSRWDYAYALVIQPDGKLVVVGATYSTTTSDDFALVRYNPDGSLDADFGSSGHVTTDFAGSGDEAYAIVIQPDGKLVVAGVSSGDFALARYNSDGTLDAGFGTGGKTITDLGVYAYPYALAIQGDGKLVVAGSSGVPGVFTLVRYDTNGSLDSAFGTGGIATAAFGSFGASARAIAIQPDGKLVAAGDDNNGHFAIARFQTNGALDTSFGTGGKVTASFGYRAYALAIQPDGRLVVAGDTYGFGLAQYNADGTLDASFGTGGKVTTVFGGTASAQAIAIQTDGKLVAAGYAYNGSNDDFALARYLSTPTALRYSIFLPLALKKP